MTLDDVKKLNIPTLPGSYQFYNEAGGIIYVGKAANLKSRVLSYWQKSTEHTPAKAAMVKEVAVIKWVEVESEIEALLLESNLIKKHQPPFNVLLRDDKRFAYVKVSLEDEVPGVFVTRNISKSGKYYGPFVSVSAVKETLKIIRKIWPYCTERKIKAKPCFYHQVGRCLGVCGGVVTRKEYMDRVIKPIQLFFEGKKSKVISELQTKISKIEKELRKKGISSVRKEELEEELRSAKYQLLNMKNVLSHAHILGLEDKYATDVVELAKVLGLPKTPVRIEGYDISNIFGQEAVGSMVVFEEGEPNKGEYRKFKIKIGQGQASDTRMLKEVMERRFKRSVSFYKNDDITGLDNDGIIQKDVDEKWPLPDLIIIDGGKGQLNVVTAVLKKFKLEIPLISISKGEGLRSGIAPDKLFFPGEKKPLELPLASPALHLIKRVRDEAHRFAIGYHRKLRSKNWLTR
ncbi:excinuclease ABC subunit UvrC [Candidatus Falkowbacteria bacterium]|nr:excinuclease ABC subunit UvrC [Candidatus Falkowbacteria bacterium]